MIRLPHRLPQLLLIVLLLLLLAACQPPGLLAEPTATPAAGGGSLTKGTPVARATPDAPRPTESAAATAAPTRTPRPSAASGGDSSQDVTLPNEAAMIESAESIRFLEATSPVPVRLMSRREFSEEYFPQSIEEDIDPAQVEGEEAILKLFGILGEGDELMQIYLDLYGEQVAGFYDTEENVFYLVTDAPPESLTVTDRITFIHEFVHALQDQHFDLDAHFESETMSSDELLAYTALVEGDAQTATFLYLFTALSPEDTMALMDEEVDSTIFDNSPPYLQESLLFPYQEGGTFVAEQMNSGGWDRINAIWAAPPVSTEQILHPERYPDDLPIEVALPDDLTQGLDSGWQEATRDRMGEYMLRMLLQHGAGADGVSSASSAAEGWGGDEYAVLTNGTQRALIIEWVWDDNDEADEAREALNDYLVAAGLAAGSAGRYQGDGRAAYLSQDGATVRFIFSNAPEVIEPLAATLTGQ